MQHRMLGSLDVFTEVATVMAVAAAVGAIARWLRQPLIVAYMLVGVLIGPVGLDVIHSHAEIDLLAELGIGLLLFVVGLKLDPHLVRAVGPVAVLTGVGQMTLTAGLGYALALALGFTGWKAFYVAAALTFSSTIIVVKLLSDKREIDALHGRIALGILIVQDLVVVLLMLALTAWAGGPREAGWGLGLLEVVGKGAVFLALVVVAARYVLPPLLHALARLPELLVLFAIAWAIGLAAIGTELGFSKEVGAFIAGVSIATTPYRATLAARLISLRDFLLLFFFIDLGVHIAVPDLGVDVAAALVLALFVLVGKPLMVAGLIGAMGYLRHTSSMTAVQLGQISEFSLILMALGVSLGQIDQRTVGLVTLVALITIGSSAYLILYSHHLYERFAPWLRVLERRTRHPERDIGDGVEAPPPHADVIVFGLGRYGWNIAWDLRRRGLEVLGVDFDPEVVSARHAQGFTMLYGDIEDPELFQTLPLEGARWVLSTLGDRDKALVLLHALRHHGFQGRVALTAHNARTRDELLEAGANVVLLPFQDAAKEAADLLTGYTASERGTPDVF